MNEQAKPRQYCVSVLGQHFMSIWAEGHESTGCEPNGGHIGLTGGKAGGYVAVFAWKPGIELSYRVYDENNNPIETKVELPLTKVNAAGATQSEDCAIAQPGAESEV